MREYIQQHPELNMTQDDIVKSTLTKAERHLKDKSDGRPDKPPPWVTQPARRRRPRPVPPPTVCVPFQERLLHVLRRADVKHEGRAEHGAHGDVQPAVEAAEAGREGRLPETLWTGEAIKHKPRKRSSTFHPLNTLTSDLFYLSEEEGIWNRNEQISECKYLYFKANIQKC